jgi:transcriptional regulator with XRE-family HTH domain
MGANQSVNFVHVRSMGDWTAPVKALGRRLADNFGIVDTFAKRMNTARLEAGFPTLQALADKAKCSKQQLSSIEAGVTLEVKMLLLYTLADTCRVSPRWLATGKGTKRNTGPMSDEERDLIFILRTLKPAARAYALERIEAISVESAETPSPVAPFGKRSSVRK